MVICNANLVSFYVQYNGHFMWLVTHKTILPSTFLQLSEDMSRGVRVVSMTLVYTRKQLRFFNMYSDDV